MDGLEFLVVGAFEALGVVFESIGGVIEAVAHGIGGAVSVGASVAESAITSDVAVATVEVACNAGEILLDTEIINNSLNSLDINNSVEQHKRFK